MYNHGMVTIASTCLHHKRVVEIIIIIIVIVIVIINIAVICFITKSAALLLTVCEKMQQWTSIGHTLQRHPLSGLLLRRMTCYTLLSVFRISMTTILRFKRPIPLMVSDQQATQRLHFTLGSPLVASRFRNSLRSPARRIRDLRAERPLMQHVF